MLGLWRNIGKASHWDDEQQIEVVLWEAKMKSQMPEAAEKKPRPKGKRLLVGKQDAKIKEMRGVP